MSGNPLRVYLDPAEIGADGYPFLWHRGAVAVLPDDSLVVSAVGAGIKDLIREQAGHRCVRCGHPYRKGQHGRGEWSRCDEHCTHGGPVQSMAPDGVPSTRHHRDLVRAMIADGYLVEAQWRILTVHHLNGVKHDCRWWNLVALCQRCHLRIQTKVFLDRPWTKPHSEWFRPYVAGFYAWKYLGEEIRREEALERLDELLALEQNQDALW